MCRQNWQQIGDKVDRIGDKLDRIGDSQLVADFSPLSATVDFVQRAMADLPVPRLRYLLLLPERLYQSNVTHRRLEVPATATDL